MMSSIDDDYVKYVMHAQVQVMDRPAIDPGLVGAQYLAPRAGARVAGHRRRPGGGPPGEEVVFAAEDGAGSLSASEVRARANGDGAGDGAVPPARVAAARLRSSTALAATTRAHAGAARSSSSATGNSCGTFPRTSRPAPAPGRGAAYLDIETTRKRLVELEPELVRPDLWMTRASSGGRPEYAALRTTSTFWTGSGQAGGR